jgi:glycosyltransferase involved in cell wall biosynthesis
MISVLHIIESARVGGISIQVIGLVNEQKSNLDLRPELLLNRPEGELISSINSMGIPVHVSKISRKDYFSLIKYIKVVRVLKNFQIIHFHSYNTFLFFCAVLSRKKIVYTIHSLHSAPGRILKKSDFLKGIIFKIFFRHFVHYLIFNSCFTQEYTIKKYKLKKKNFSMVYNGVNLIKLNNSFELKDHNKFTIGTICSLIKLKRVDVIIKAFTEAEIPDSLLVIVGKGPEFQSLIHLVQSLDKVEQVVFKGYQEDTASYYKHFDVFVSASEFETFGLVAIEAMHYGLPVLVMADGGGITEIVNNIEPDNIMQNIQQLATRIRYYYENPQAIDNKMKMRKDYADSFSLQLMERSLYGIYNTILA